MKPIEKHLSMARELDDKSDFNNELIKNIAHALAKVEEETREECCKLVCGLCDEGTIPVTFREYGGLSAWVHREGNINNPCHAAAIRRKGASNGS